MVKIKPMYMNNKSILPSFNMHKHSMAAVLKGAYFKSDLNISHAVLTGMIVMKCLDS